MANAYEGQISTLEYEILDDSYEQQLRKLANWILFTGKRAERRGLIDKKHNFFKKMVKEISESEYVEEYKKIEALVFDQIENYIKNGSNGVYTFECNDVCIGTLKYFKELFASCSNLSHSNQEKFESLVANMNKITTLTATKGESKATPNDLKYFKSENSSKLQYKNKKMDEEELGEEKEC